MRPCATWSSRRRCEQEYTDFGDAHRILVFLRDRPGAAHRARRPLQARLRRDRTDCPHQFLRRPRLRASRGTRFHRERRGQRGNAVISDRFADYFFPGPVGGGQDTDRWTATGSRSSAWSSETTSSSRCRTTSGCFGPIRCTRISANLLRLRKRPVEGNVEAQLALIAARLSIAEGAAAGKTRFASSSVHDRSHEHRQVSLGADRCCRGGAARRLRESREPPARPRTRARAGVGGSRRRRGQPKAADLSPPARDRDPRCSWNVARRLPDALGELTL